jgi:hypothetical protein
MWVDFEWWSRLEGKVILAREMMVGLLLWAALRLKVKSENEVRRFCLFFSVDVWRSVSSLTGHPFGS